ncbi:MAG: hypothetical protein C4560_03260 [Nitrospiraceae bacterium]|nr:MAG: hypothetical protein C4560_03260 [Nitrospiraceae bacterium]
MLSDLLLKKIKLLIICLLLGACATQPININIQAPPEQDDKAASILEEKMGEAGYYFLVLNFKLVDDAKTTNRLNRIGARIAAFTERPLIHYKYLIIDSVYRNAFSMPNGYIVFTGSFLDLFDQDDVLASVIAHEMAHVTHKHVVSEYHREMGKSAASIIGEKVFNDATDMHLRQAYELQADQTGLRYLYRAGYDPEAFIEALEKLVLVEKEDQERFDREVKEDPKMRSSFNKKLVPDHPLTVNRIVNVRNHIPEVRMTEEVKYDPEQFQF